MHLSERSPAQNAKSPEREEPRTRRAQNAKNQALLPPSLASLTRSSRHGWPHCTRFVSGGEGDVLPVEFAEANQPR